MNVTKKTVYACMKAEPMEKVPNAAANKSQRRRLEGGFRSVMTQSCLALGVLPRPARVVEMAPRRKRRKRRVLMQNMIHSGNGDGRTDGTVVGEDADDIGSPGDLALQVSQRR